MAAATPATVAQLDRVLASEAKGRAFESRRLHQLTPPQILAGVVFHRHAIKLRRYWSVHVRNESLVRAAHPDVTDLLARHGLVRRLLVAVSPTSGAASPAPATLPPPPASASAPRPSPRTQGSRPLPGRRAERRCAPDALVCPPTYGGPEGGPAIGAMIPIPIFGVLFIVSLIQATRTRKGLKVRAALDQRHYPKGIKVTKAEMADPELHSEALNTARGADSQA